jgi:hypothetical protein
MMLPIDKLRTAQPVRTRSGETPKAPAAKPPLEAKIPTVRRSVILGIGNPNGLLSPGRWSACLLEYQRAGLPSGASRI